MLVSFFVTFQFLNLTSSYGHKITPAIFAPRLKKGLTRARPPLQNFFIVTPESMHPGEGLIMGDARNKIRSVHIIRVVGVVCLFFLASTTTAFGLSSITNSFSADDYTISTGQTIYLHARSVYGWVYFPNPYSSNFVTEVNAYHFRRPQTYQSSGLSNPNNWLYYSTGLFTSPCYRLHEYWFFIVPPMTAYVRFTSVAESAPSNTRRGHRHGQSVELNWDISYGGPAWIYTTHN